MITDGNFKFAFWLGSVSICMTLWAFMLFQKTEFFGPLLKIFIKMVKDLAKFFVFYMIILIAFSGSANIYFYGNANFTSFWIAMQYLFQVSIGQLDFTVANTFTLVWPDFGKVYLWIYMLLMNLTLLNFIIALLTDTYGMMRTNSKAL